MTACERGVNKDQRKRESGVRMLGPESCNALKCGKLQRASAVALPVPRRTLLPRVALQAPPTHHLMEGQ